MFSRIRRSMFNGASNQVFSGVRVIHDHLEKRSKIEGYVNGVTRELPDLSSVCQPDCLLGIWLHGAGGDKCKDIALLDSLRNNCQQFHEAAAQVVLWADMGEIEKAREYMQSGQLYAEASEKFQEGLVELHTSLCK